MRQNICYTHATWTWILSQACPDKHKDQIWKSYVCKQVNVKHQLQDQGR